MSAPPPSAPMDLVSYWIRYILVPIVGGSLAAAGLVVTKRRAQRGRWRRLHEGVIAASMLACGGFNLRDLAEIARELNVIGKGLFPAILMAEVGIGLLPGIAWLGRRLTGDPENEAAFRRRLAWAERRLGFLAIGTGVAMLLVRGSILVIF